MARPINYGALILTIFGFASKYLNKTNDTSTYRNRTVYPFYILHQTVMIVMAFYMVDINMHYGLKIVILVVGVFGITWTLYEFVIRRVKLVPPLFGIK
jgi:glucan biosynthesis protein C